MGALRPTKTGEIKMGSVFAYETKNGGNKSVMKEKTKIMQIQKLINKIGNRK